MPPSSGRPRPRINTFMRSCRSWKLEAEEQICRAHVRSPGLSSKSACLPWARSCSRACSSSPSAGSPLKDGEYIQSSRPAGQLSDMAASATESLDQATALLKDIRAGKGTVGKLFTDEQLYREFNQLIGSAQQVTGYMSRGQGTFGKLLRDPKAYQQFQAALTNLQETTRRINAGEGSLGRLLKDEAFAKSLTSATANFD